MQNGKFFGIDFGTTNTSVYMYNVDQSINLVTETKYGDEGDSQYPFSSYIAIPKNGGEFLFGRDVKEKINELSDDYEIVRSFKSLIASEKVVNGRRYSGEFLVSEFLSYVRATVLKKDKIVSNDEFKKIVMSIPVGFTGEERRILKKAAENAGFEVEGFITESSAAYISKVKDIKAYSKVLVIDWGGGTLDLSLLDLEQSRVYEEAVDGDKIGGDDIDLELVKRLQPKMYPDVPFDDLDPAKKDRLIKNVEVMKIDFSTGTDDYDLVCLGAKPVSVSYDYFYDVVSPIVNSRVLPAIDRIMKTADVTPAGIDAVILAGGSCGLSPFYEAVADVFGYDKIIDDDEYQWMVAKGAAIASALSCEYVLGDDLCLMLSDDTLYPILEKGKAKANKHFEPVSFGFSVTDESPDAHFIFTDSKGKIYKRMSVKAKGYIDEIMEMSIALDVDQTAKILIKSPKIDKNYNVSGEINKLRFYYDLADF